MQDDQLGFGSIGTLSQGASKTVGGGERVPFTWSGALSLSLAIDSCLQYPHTGSDEADFQQRDG